MVPVGRQLPQPLPAGDGREEGEVQGGAHALRLVRVWGLLRGERSPRRPVISTHGNEERQEPEDSQDDADPPHGVEELDVAMNAEEQPGLRLLQFHFVALVDLLVEGLGNLGHVWDC